jgi:hypothetical protein
MKPINILLLATVLAVNGAAFAASAEYMDTARRIDAAMASGKFTPSTTDEARRLRAESDRMMREGKEAEAMKLLEQVKALLKTK